MKAIVIHDFGDAGVLQYEDVPIPEIKEDQVLIKIRAAGINPVDWKIRDGMRRNYISSPFPLILGWDASGTVEKKGKSAGLDIGDAVYACTNVNRNGTYAEYVAAGREEIAPKPQSLDFIQAAAVPLASQTAWQGLFEEGGLRQGQRVLIHGASGGVGTFAVQFAKVAGAYVAGTASERNLELIRSLGVDEPIDYRSQDFSRLARDMDLVLDTIGGKTQEASWGVLKKGGVLVSTLGINDSRPPEAAGKTGKGMVMVSKGNRLREIGKLIDAGKVKVIIEKVFPWNEIRQAHELSQSGRARGKIVLQVA